MNRIGVIGGSAFLNGDFIDKKNEKFIDTPYGQPSAPLISGNLDGLEIIFLQRHGINHQYLPHKINYRANIWALNQIGVNKIISVNTVGGITSLMAPGEIVLPDQIIDYTNGREHTFYDQNEKFKPYINFTEPYCSDLIKKIRYAAELAEIKIIFGGTYGATQGPRLESQAEINRLFQDGCDIVGMTGMPEASLALELELCYVNISLVVNWAAGINEQSDLSEIKINMEKGLEKVRGILKSGEF